MASLVHATIRVTGPREQRDAFRARLLFLLSREPVHGEIEERHSGSDLFYDLKVDGGIPFPPFVAASAEAPDLDIHAEWFNADAGMEGEALIRNGVLKDHRVAARPAPAGAGVYLEVEPSGRIALAMACREHAPGNFSGYAASAERDALFLVTRTPGEQAGELLATAGSGNAWAEHWLLDFEADVCEHGALEPARPIADSLLPHLEESARQLLREWIWLASAPVEEIVVERRRFEEGGREIRPVNLRSRRLRELEGQSSGARKVVDTLPSGLGWLKEVMRECWAEAGRTD